MSYFGTDPGDLTPSEMYGHEPHGEIVKAMPCPACQERDGSPDQELIGEMEGIGCVFGCGALVDTDCRLCRDCQDHSANHVECDRCGRAYEDWSGTWEEMK